VSGIVPPLNNVAVNLRSGCCSGFRHVAKPDAWLSSIDPGESIAPMFVGPVYFGSSDRTHWRGVYGVLLLCLFAISLLRVAIDSSSAVF